MDLAHQDRLKGAALRRTLSLPRPALRAIAGRPVVIEGQTLDVENHALLRLHALVGDPDVATLPLELGRHRVDVQAAMVGGAQPIGTTRDLRVSGGDGEIGARLYTPRGLLARRRPAPLLVFFHGGGMVYGSLDSHDATCRVLAEQAGVRVLAVDYRLAPEHPFPAGVEDAFAAYRWAVEHADDLGADPARIAVAGDSAGGYLAATTALRAAEEGVPCAWQLLVYPVTDWTGSRPSRRTFGDGFYLSTTFMDRATAAYCPAGVDLSDPWVSVLCRSDFPSGLAPAHVVTAGFDPLRDEGEEYADALSAAGVAVTRERFPGFIHVFFNVVGAGRTVPAAVRRIADRVAAALE